MSDDVTDRIRDSYESVPYRAGPHYAAHPDCLATVARLLGLAAADVARCRVLELGCATGGHLIPMALTLPHSEFVGVDLAPGHIRSARETAAALGLRNTRFEAADLRDLPTDLGRFDYVVCHGVYSWVPDDVREALWPEVHAHLADDGLAMVSFNALPGSQPRDSVRGLFRFALERVLAGEDPVEDARALLTIVPPALDGVEGAFVDQLRTIAGECRDEEAYYLAHEYLAPVNRAFHMWEVAADAEAAGLRWVWDAWDHDDGADLPDATRALMDRLSPSALERRQWLDLIRDSAFRRAVFCRADRTPAKAFDPAVVADLHASGGAWPVAEGRQADSGEARPASAFASRTHRLSTNVPIVEVALRRLHDAWPASLPVRELWRESRDEVRDAGADPQAPDDLDYLSGALLQCYRHHLVTLHVHPFAVATEPGERPTASALARYEADLGAEVTNLVHQRVRLDSAALAVLRLLDGSRTAGDVRGALVGDVATAPALERVWASIEVLTRAGLVHPAAEG